MKQESFRRILLCKLVLFYNIRSSRQNFLKDLINMQALMVLSSSIISFALCLFMFFCTSCRDGVVYADIIGSQETCDIENESISVTDIPNMKCFDCNCKNGFVECKKQKCPSIEGCYMLQRSQQKDECCKKCKGCMKNDVYHDSETEWVEPKEPCKLLKCTAGIITESLLHCYTPCKNPSPPNFGKCCPTCPDCHVNGKKIFKETYIMSEKDPCVSCSCTSGKLTCIKRTCPVLNCPKSKILNNFEECCPQCLGTGKFIDPPKGACLIGTTIYQSGKQFSLDSCVICNCKNSTIHCEKNSCPILQCKREYQEIFPDRCCAQCRNIHDKIQYEIIEKQEDFNNKSFINVNEDEDDDTWNNKYYLERQVERHKTKNESSCVYAKKIYKNGENWNTTGCETCICMQTKINCTAIMCPSISCKPNSILKIPNGQCCPECVESYGVCTVFGGVHFRTFDGKMYAFIGSCNYQLATDCDSGTFNIRLKNMVIGNDSIIKKLILKLGNVRVELKQNKNTKVNEEIVELPYRSKNNLDISEINENIIIVTKIGIKINWNYMGFLEIIVPTHYHKKLCGLCGNFNFKADDDLTTREGILVEDPAIFAQSWTSGDEICLETRKYEIRGCNPRKHERICNYIRGSAFEKCVKKLNVTAYYKICLRDMCLCSPEDLQCHCESFTNYVRDCRRLGILLPRWRKSVGC